MHLVLRADAGPAVGLGHAVRCSALAERWIERGGRATLVGEVPQGLVSAGIPVVVPPRAGDEAAALVASLEPRWLVADGYDFDLAAYRDLHREGVGLLVMDDVAHRALYDCDVLVNQNFGAERLEYATSRHTVRLLGVRYALLRAAFRRARPPSQAVPELATRILITLGGADPDNVTLGVLEALARPAFASCEIVAIVGSANRHRVALEAAAACMPNVKLEIAPPDVAGLMQWAHVAITAAGSTCWESAYMGLPSLVLLLADNQETAYRSLCEAGAVVALGTATPLEPDAIAARVAEVCASVHTRARLALHSRRLVDGRGADRVLDAMLEAQAA